MLDHASTQAEVDEAMMLEAQDALLLQAVRETLKAAIRLQACKDWADLAAAEEGQHKSGTGEQGTARPSDSPMTVCEWLRLEGVL